MVNLKLKSKKRQIASRSSRQKKTSKLKRILICGQPSFFEALNKAAAEAKTSRSKLLRDAFYLLMKIRAKERREAKEKGAKLDS